jgi:DNA polymerase III, alpha subunit
MVPGAFLYIKFKIVEGFLNRETNQRGEPRIQFMQMMQLQDVMETLSKKLTLHVNIEEINQDLIAKYKDLLQKHKGKQSIYFVVHHHNENIHLNMENGNLKVAITKSFLDDLDALFAKYHLNDRRMEKIVAKKTEDTHDDEEMAMEDLGLSE